MNFNYRNKQNSSISLFTWALQGGSSLAGHRNLTSSTVFTYIPPKGHKPHFQDTNDFNPNFKLNFERLNYVRPLTGATFSFEIEHLESIKDQDILSWRRKFIKAIETCSWSPEFAFDYLLALVDVKYHEQFEGVTIVDEALLRLVSVKYPRSTSERFSRRLATLSQNNFHDIEYYMKAIEDILLRWAAAVQASEEEISSKREATFMNGLSNETQNFIDLQNIKIAEHVLQRIKETEENIKHRHKSFIDGINNKKWRQNGNNFSYKNYQGNPKNGPKENRSTPSQFNQYNNSFKQKHVSKWCKYHKSNGHNSEECRFLKSQNTQNSTRQENQNFAILEQTELLKKISLDLELNNNDYEAILDTGSSKSFVTKKLLK